MHQTADTSFPARRGLGFGLRLVRAKGLAHVVRGVSVGGPVQVHAVGTLRWHRPACCHEFFRKP